MRNTRAPMRFYCLLLLLIAGSANGQFDNRVGINQPPFFDVSATFGIPINNQAAAALSRATLQEKIDSKTHHAYPWFFPAALGGTSQNMPYHINDSLVLPEDTGRQFEGAGRYLASSQNGTLRSSYLCLRAWTFQTIFDGAARKLTSSGPSNVVTVTGRSVAARDRYNTVHITGGTNVTPGYYGIESVDTRNNRWILDRNWCTAAVANGAAKYVPAMVTDMGAGRVWKSLGLSFKQLPSDPVDGTVCYHVASSYGPDNRRSTGYQHFTDCGFFWGEVGILNGRYLNHADPFDLNRFESSWTGITDDQSDNLVTDSCFFVGKVGVYANNSLSLIHTHHNMRCQISNSVFFFAAGGKLRADGIEINGATGKQCVLTLGPMAYENNVNMFNVQNVSFDGNTSRPQLIFGRSQNMTQTPNITIGHVSMFSQSPDSDLPRVDIDGRAMITLHHITGWAAKGSTGIPSGSLRLKANAAGYRPTVTISHSLLGSSNPADLLHAESDAGTVVVLGPGNYLNDGTLVDETTYKKP